MDELADAKLDVRTSREGSATVFHLAGDLDLATVPRLRDAIRTATADASATKVFDLAAVTFMDSSGLSVFLELAASGGPLLIRSPSDTMRRVIETTGVDRTLRMEP